MANKTLRTRQKLVFRVTLTPRQQKPRNPVAMAAGLRAAGSHRKSAAALRQAQRRALKKTLADSGED